MSVESIATICSVAVALVAAVFSFISAWRFHKHNSRELAVAAITSNRMNWIADVRKLLIHFCEQYRVDSSDTEKLSEIRTSLLLYVRYDRKELYGELIDELDYCCSHSNSFCEDEYKRLVILSQYTLAQVWARVRIEGGESSLENEPDIRKKIDERVERLHGMLPSRP